MNKKKVMLVTLGIGAIGLAKVIIDKTRDNKKRRAELEENLLALSLLQDDFNAEVVEEFEGIKEEIGSVYEHMEKLLEMKEVQCEYADECEESDCFYEEYADKMDSEQSKNIHKEDEK